MSTEAQSARAKARAELRSALATIGKVMVPHTYFETTLTQLRALDPERSLVFLFGVTGVGKSALACKLVSELFDEGPGDGIAVPGAIVNARTSRTGPFSWKEFWILVLMAMYEPLPRSRVYVPPRPRSKEVQRKVDALRVRVRKATEYTLRWDAMEAIRKRSVRYLVIDEALALSVVESGGDLARQLDKLREFADDVTCQIIIVATPRIVVRLQASGELNRRKRPIVFPRYACEGPKAEAEVRKFHGVARAFMRQLPPWAQFELSNERLRVLRDGSFGCVGVLADWWRDAVALRLASALDPEQPVGLQWSDFLDTVMPDEDREKTRHEITSGEKRLEEATRRTLGASTRGTCADGEAQRDFASHRDAQGESRGAGRPSAEDSGARAEPGKAKGKRRGSKRRVAEQKPRRPKVDQ